MLTAIAARLSRPAMSLATALFTLSVVVGHTEVGGWLLVIGITLFVLNTGQAVLRAYVNRVRN
jgi:hypothetical protein